MNHRSVLLTVLLAATLLIACSKKAERADPKLNDPPPEGEAQGAHEVETGAEGEAGASGVAGVPRDLGVDENDVERGVAGPVHGRMFPHAPLR